jgi:amino acid adenylation domain-containing protein
VTLNRSRPLRRPLTSIYGAVAQCVRDRPDAAAVQSSAGRLTYRELEQQVTALAGGLGSAGIGAGAFVPIYDARRTEYLVSILAALRCGAAFVPVDPAWSDPLLQRLLHDFDARFIVGAAGDRVPEGVSLMPADAATCDIAIGGDACDVVPDAPMYAMFTSGTTGTPRAVVVPHRGILNRFAWMSEFLGREVRPITLQTTAAMYDSSVWQLLWPLTCGGMTVIPEEHVLLDARELTTLVQAARVNVIDFVPSVLSALIEPLEEDPETAHRFRSLAWIIVGGEEISPQVMARIRRLAPRAAVMNLYGPTEASIGCIGYEVADLPRLRVPIGRPIPNVRAFLIDERGELTPRGAIGELLLAGDCVALGYRGADQGGFGRCANIPELDGQPRYATGDLCRWDDRGALEYIGRKDRQLKVRGVRIEADAIRAALESHPSVLSAIVDLDRTAGPHPQLVASVTPAHSGPLDAAALRAYLRLHLPATHVPDRIELLGDVPIGRSGKRADTTRERRPETRPQSVADLESRVAGVWEQIIGPPDIVLGGAMTFFDAGGSSLALIELRQRLNAAFNVRLSILDLFRHPTLAAQAELLHRTHI